MARRAFAEGVRWAAAVGMVVAIALAGLAVRVWPGPAVTPPLPASTAVAAMSWAVLPLVPASELAVEVSAPRAVAVAKVAPPVSLVGSPSAPPAVMLDEPIVPVELPVPVDAPLLLDSRALSVAIADAPALFAEPVTLDSPPRSVGPFGLATRPVKGVIETAGRGIVSGLRATSAVIRAAF